jgi:predicted DNA-binding transcriptional regulator AlpA
MASVAEVFTRPASEVTTLLSRAFVCKLLGKTSPELFDEIRAGRFPPPVLVNSEHGKAGAVRLIAWSKKDIDDWRAKRKAAQEPMPSNRPRLQRPR